MTELLNNFTFLLLSQILQGTFCNFVAMDLNGLECHYCNVSMCLSLRDVSLVCLKDVSLKSESFSLIASGVSRWWKKNMWGGGAESPQVR